MGAELKQIKTGKNTYTAITDDTIQRIAKVDAFGNLEMNNMMYEHHKKLLNIAKKYGDKEVGLFWNMNDITKPPLVLLGERNGIDVSCNKEVNSLVKYNRNAMSVVIMHNHPRNGLFSSQDVQSFIDFNSIYIMTAICNDGTIYMMRKEINFDPFLLKRYYDEGLDISIKMWSAHGGNKDNGLGKPYYCGIKNVAKHAKEIGITYRCSVKRR